MRQIILLLVPIFYIGVTAVQADTRDGGDFTGAPLSTLERTVSGSPEVQVLSRESSQAGTSQLTAVVGLLKELCEKPAKGEEETCKEAHAEIIAAIAAQITFSMEVAKQSDKHVFGVLDRQSSQSEIIFWGVVVVVGLGVLAAALQFYLVWRSESQHTTELRISEKELSIKTAWIGVVLLALSMVFFLIYLRFVFTISVV